MYRFLIVFECLLDRFPMFSHVFHGFPTIFQLFSNYNSQLGFSLPFCPAPVLFGGLGGPVFLGSVLGCVPIPLIASQMVISHIIHMSQ